MLPLLCLFATQVPIDQPPRLRTVLPNGVVLLVERRPKAKSLIVDLFVANRMDEEPATHGQRHLLEHLTALGPNGDLDMGLESAGGYLNARTARDSISFEMTLPPDRLSVGLDAIKQIVSPPKIDADVIGKEASTMEQEDALREDASRASSAVWAKGFGSLGLDPFGDPKTIRNTRPDDLERLRKRAFAAPNLVVIVSGDVDLDGTTSAVREALAFLPAVKKPKMTAPPAPTTSATESIDLNFKGEFRGVPVTGFRAPGTAATLAAALALGGRLDHAQMIYTPSVRPGMIILGRSSGPMGNDLQKLDPAELFEAGRLMAIRWVRSRLEDPEQAADFRGTLLCQAVDVRPETMIENLSALKYADFERAVNAFKSGAVVVEGRS